MKRAAELYLIGKRVKRTILIMFVSISIILGAIVGIILKSFIVSILLVIVLSLMSIVIARKYYWIISNNGIFTPSNFGIKKYVIVMLKYVLTGVDMSNIVFINYRMISYLNLISEPDGLGIQIIQKNNNLISIVIRDEAYNQDLINSINYIKRKGINIKNLNVLERIKIINEEELKIQKKKL